MGIETQGGKITQRTDSDDQDMNQQQQQATPTHFAQQQQQPIQHDPSAERILRIEQQLLAMNATLQEVLRATASDEELQSPKIVAATTYSALQPAPLPMSTNISRISIPLWDRWKVLTWVQVQQRIAEYMTAAAHHQRTDVIQQLMLFWIKAKVLFLMEADQLAPNEVSEMQSVLQMRLNSRPPQRQYAPRTTQRRRSKSPSQPTRSSSQPRKQFQQRRFQ